MSSEFFQKCLKLITLKDKNNCHIIISNINRFSPFCNRVIFITLLSLETLLNHEKYKESNRYYLIWDLCAIFSKSTPWVPKVQLIGWLYLYRYMSLYYLWYRETDGVSYPYHTVNIHCWLNNWSNYYFSILRVSVMVFNATFNNISVIWWLEENISKRFILWNLFTPPYSWNIANVGVKRQPIHQSFLMLSLL